MPSVDLDAVMTGMIASSVQIANKRLDFIADQNAQLLSGINATLFQQHGGVADDAPQYGSMQTASGVPAQGSLSPLAPRSPAT